MRRPLLAVLERFGVSRERVERHAERLRERGLRGVAISRATPGIRVIAVAASALAALPFGPFLIGLIVGNTAFVGLHFLLGFVIGPPAVAAVATFGVAITGLAVVLAVLGAAGWWWLRRRRARHASTDVETAYADWADATCPVCLTLGLAGVRIDEG
jgi:membrane protein DedA with SNARE-associated domain